MYVNAAQARSGVIFVKKLGILVIALVLLTMAIAAPVSATNYVCHDPWYNQQSDYTSGCMIATLAMLQYHNGHSDQTQAVLHNSPHNFPHPGTLTDWSSYTTTHGYGPVDRQYVYGDNKGHTPNYETQFTYIKQKIIGGTPVPMVYNRGEDGVGHMMLIVGVDDVTNNAYDRIYCLDPAQPDNVQGYTWAFYWKDFVNYNSPMVGGVYTHPELWAQTHY